MLLDTGYPVNWGSELTFDPEKDIQRFGLASSKSPSLYVLDPNKVERMGEELLSPYWKSMGYDRVRDLLGSAVIHQSISETEGLVDIFMAGNDVTMMIPIELTDLDWEP